jgi:hypothetical protein
MITDGIDIAIVAENGHLRSITVVLNGRTASASDPPAMARRAATRTSLSVPAIRTRSVRPVVSARRSRAGEVVCSGSARGLARRFKRDSPTRRRALFDMSRTVTGNPNGFPVLGIGFRLPGYA